MREMKDSGVDWIGKIPNSWELKKGKYLFFQKNEKGNTKCLQLLSPTQNYGVIPQSLYEELSGMSAVKLNERADLSELKTVHKGAFCISLRSFQGGFEYSEYEGVVSPAYQIFYPTTLIKDGYYRYLFKTEAFIQEMNSFTMSLRDGKNIAFSDFGNSLMPIPPIDDQKRIASFLDSKCAEIDSITADIQKEIETLQEYLKSVITEAVTKGLDSNVEMKDSGIAWIGEIPVDWSVKPFWELLDKTYNPIADGPFGSDMKNEDYVDEGVPVIQIGTVKAAGLDFSKIHYISEKKANTLKRHNALPGNLVITKMMPPGKCCIAPNVFSRYVVSADVIRASVSSPMLRKFIFYACNAYITIQATADAFGSTRDRISVATLKRYKFAIPPSGELEDIVLNLDSKCLEIDSIVKDKQKQLDTLAEYRKSLIFEYVTGKKEVPAV